MNERVVITGIGIISPIGNSKDEYFKNLLKGNSPVKIAKIPNANGNGGVDAIIAEASDFKPEALFKYSKLKRLDRSTQMAVPAVLDALIDASLNLSHVDIDRFGIYTGISSGGISFASDQIHKALIDGITKISAFMAIAEFPSSCLGEVSIFLGAKGKGNSISTASNSSLDAIGLAYKEIAYGNLDYAIAGGTEAPLIGVCYYSLAKIGLLTSNFANPSKASRPFDSNRDGLVLAEGACFLILEPLSRAKVQNKKIYAELVDYECSFDPEYTFKRKTSRPVAVRTLVDLLRRNELLPEYISAFAPSEKIADKVELELLKEVFDHKDIRLLKKLSGLDGQLMLGSIKSIIGHSLGACGAFQIASACLSMEQKVIPPTINLENPEPECDYFNIPTTRINHPLETVLINGLDFLGNNSFILLRKCAE